tara:strand:+ start:6694 stop:6990 length:297 start_codon:yes stop_codon:yes gene_type:complete
MDNKFHKIGMVSITREMRDLQIMKDWQLCKNEAWFNRIIASLSENGIWVWNDNPTFKFIKKGDRILCCRKGYKAVSQIVTPKYLQDNFINNEKHKQTK